MFTGSDESVSEPGQHSILIGQSQHPSVQVQLVLLLTVLASLIVLAGLIVDFAHQFRIQAQIKTSGVG